MVLARGLTVYYAVPHSPARAAADLLIGRNRSAARYRAYRALEHGSARPMMGAQG